MKNLNQNQSLNFGSPSNRKITAINNQDKMPRFTGKISISLVSRYASIRGDNFYEFCKKNKLQNILRFLESAGTVSVERVIKSKQFDSVQKFEKLAQRTEFAPIRSLCSYWTIDFNKLLVDNKISLEELVNSISKLPEVAFAYMEHTPSLPVVNASDDPLYANQTYLTAAPAGVDAEWAWTQTDCEGAGVGVIDCEWGWVNDHEDLISSSPTVIHNDNCYGSGSTSFGAVWYDHGTAVLGQILGTDNTLGVIGMTPSLDYVKMSSFYDAATDSHANTATAIVAAFLEMRPGDIMLLEIQKGFLPTEMDLADFDAIRLASANGVIVIEAAGNGNIDLDAWLDSFGNARMNRTDLNFQDSGAIMVGACNSAVTSAGHNRAWFSNYGTRIDCHAWGENIYSTGYGDLSGSGDTNNYTDTFGGTSGASPIIVGCAAILQGKYKAINGTILSPMQMRLLLSDPATGTPQDTAVSGFINVMPNLRAIIENTLGLVADVYLRDSTSDNGVVPSSGAISISPDIIVLPNAVANPTLAFGEGSGTENSYTLGSSVESGQDNFIYARMKNRGLQDATNTTATVYWSEVSSLVTPDMWNLIGTTNPINVPVGNILEVTDAIIWDKDNIPATGHYCFVGILDSPNDPAPVSPGSTSAFDWSQFENFIRNNNNVTWRNFNVVNNLPDVPSATAVFPFLIANAPDHSREFNLQIFQQLPKDAELWIEIPLVNRNILKGIDYLEIKENKKSKTISIKLPKTRSLKFNAVKLNRKARIKCNFIIKGSKQFAKGTHYFGIRQFFGKLEVGRVSWALEPKKTNK